VSALNNGWGSSVIQFSSPGEGDKPVLVASRLSLIEGLVRRVFPTGKGVIKSRDYIPIRGVRPGENTLTFKQERYGELEAQDVTILPSSGIEVATKGPALVVFQFREPRQPWRLGKPSILTVWMRNRGGRPARGVTIRLEYDTDSFRVRPKGTQGVGTLRPKESRIIRFKVIPLARGRFVIGVAGTAVANRPGDSIELAVR
jgi:hypothetical protein